MLGCFFALLLFVTVTGAPFVTTWNTNTTNEIVSFPTITPQTNVTIDWGDNTTLGALSANVTYSSLNHTYATPGKHNVSISGEFRWTVISMTPAEKLKLLDIVSWGDGFLVDQDSGVNLFNGCGNMQVSAPPSTQPVFLPGATLESMFQATAFNSSLNWDLKNVTSLQNMFYSTPLNKPIIFTNMQGVTTMAGMFQNAFDFNQPINFDCSSVTSLDFMFSGASSFNSALNLSNTQAVVNAQYLFYQASEFNQPINFSAPNLVNAANMFYGASKFNQSVELGTQKLTSTVAMFYGALEFNQPITFPTDYVTTMNQMFFNARVFNQPINFSSSFNLGSTAGMFANAASFNQPVIMATGNVTNMNSMFRNASSFASPVNFTSTSKVTNMANMFDLTDFTHNLASWNTSQVLFCTNFCAFCGLPSFTCNPCGIATRVNTTENTTVCNTRAPSTAVPTTTAPTAAPTSTSGPSLAPSTAMAVSAAKAAGDCCYSMMAVLLCSLWVSVQ